jgi:hypothetical protein
MKVPEAPTGVVITCHDGTTVPAELSYRGRHFDWREGAFMHQWIVTACVRATDFAYVNVKTLPPRTSIVIELVLPMPT